MYFKFKDEGGWFLLLALFLLLGLFIVAASVMPSFIETQGVVLAKKAASEISYIQDAALWRKKEMGSHASSMAQLISEGRLPNISYINPWGSPYILDTSSGNIIVNTTVPSKYVNIFSSLLPGVTSTILGDNATISSNGLSP